MMLKLHVDTVLQTEAVDPNGNTVRVLQRIPINGTQVNQYFYETMCVPDLIYEEDEIFGTSYRRSEDSRNSECNGIDKSVSYVDHLFDYKHCLLVVHSAVCLLTNSK